MQEASYLSLAAMAERTDRQPFPTEGLSYLTLLYAAIGISGVNPSNSLRQNAALSGPLADFRKTAVHSSQVSMASAGLFSQYIDFIQDSYPFMTTAELEDCFNVALRASESNGTQGLLAEAPETMVLSYIGLATGTLSSPDYTFKEFAATEFITQAIELLPRVFDNANDISIVRCLTALTIYSMFTTLGGSTWHLLGLTMSRCVASGMHTSRISDPSSDDEEKRKRFMTFWTLYVLDTDISAALSRPFCISDDDIVISPPHASASENFGKLRFLAEHAQLLRSIRQQIDTDAWIHYINLRQWYETVHSMTQSSQAITPSLLHSRLLIRGIVELIKQPASMSSSNWEMILLGAEPDVEGFLKLLEESLLQQHTAPSALDAFHTFACGILVMQLPTKIDGNMIVAEQTASRLVTRQRTISQAISILTVLSVRHPPVRSLRDVLAEYYAVCLREQQLASSEHLRELIEKSEISISTQLQNLVLGDRRLQ
jgi:hypothetical protein